MEDFEFPNGFRGNASGNHWKRARQFKMIPRMSSRRLLLLFFAFLALYAAGDWALPLIDRDEPRFAEPPGRCWSAGISRPIFQQPDAVRQAAVDLLAAGCGLQAVRRE